MSEDDRRHSYEDAPLAAVPPDGRQPPLLAADRRAQPTARQPANGAPGDDVQSAAPPWPGAPGRAHGQPADHRPHPAGAHALRSDDPAPGDRPRPAQPSRAHPSPPAADRDDASRAGAGELPRPAAFPAGAPLDIGELPWTDPGHPTGNGTDGRPPGAGGAQHGAGGGESGWGGRGKPQVKKLRLLTVLVLLSLLAIVSAIFGMIMAIASDLPALENRAEYKLAKNSVLLDINGTQIGVLTGRDNRILVAQNDIPFMMKRAMIAVEDRRFYSNSGVDLKGIVRALVADIFKQRAAQGASTVTQQFVKNALRAQNKRTVFEKLREAALAYHLTRKWSKDKILTEYLNSIYFGNGAYGIESAARTYFGHDPSSSQNDCGTTGQPLCVQGLVRPEEAALLAGIVASPSAYDPVTHPGAALNRRNLVLKDMYAQGYLTAAEYQDAIQRALPAREFILPPEEKVIEPGVAYFTTWVKQQLVDHYPAAEAFDGGLVVHTTLDLELQRKAERAIAGYLADPSGPSAALVAIDNATGEVRALVGGRDFKRSPFNLATEGQRQPGSAFKPFVLAQALEQGISPNSVWPSRKRTFVVPHTHGRDHFVVKNYEGSYAGTRTLADATRVSDNSVFAAVAISTGTAKIAALAREIGIRTPVSTNYAISLGGLRRGVTPLDMAHAYETIAHDGQRVYGTLGAPMQGPVGIHSVTVPGQSQPDRNKLLLRRVLPSGIDRVEQGILKTVVTSGTGHAAALGVWSAGKTGTTENYGDAWFIGFTRRMTVAVWVGYPDRLRSMKTDFGGSPVAGGTFPALIWHDFMASAEDLYANRAAARAARSGQAQSGTTTTTTGDAGTAPPTSTGRPARSAATGDGTGDGSPATSSTPARSQAPSATTPSGAATPTPTQGAPAPGAPPPGGPSAPAPAATGAPANPAAVGGAAGGAQGPSG